MSDYYNRVSTICPGGLSQGLSSFLETPVPQFGSNFKMRNYLAAMLLKPYRETQCPFCCTFIGWASKKYDPQTLFTFLDPLENIRVTTSNQKATAAGFGFDVGYATIKVLGVWPFTDLTEPGATNEYQKYCFLAKPEICDDLLQWSHTTFIEEACKSDPIGIVCAVTAKSADLADNKMNEILQLLQFGANQAFQQMR
jgi:hypothetical protein